jgi:elongator complex protein 3
MPNLYKSDLKKDTEDYEKLWQQGFRPDELKIYPTSLMRGTYLYKLYQDGKYKPYSDLQLKSILKKLMVKTPRYCRLTRVIRDIPSEYVVAGNKVSNLRQIVEKELVEEGNPCQCIRCREIKGKKVNFEELEYEQLEYETSVGKEIFMSYRTKDDKLVGFLRLSLPVEKSFIIELGKDAVIREVHVYGEVESIGKKGKSQHLGVGSSLIEKAKQFASENGYNHISVISAVGTREYYRKLGFELGELYMRSRTVLRPGQ